MKTEDFERLKAICEKEGFEIGFKYDESTYTVRLKKDHWYGVEFAEYLFPWPGQRDHFKVKQITEKMVIATDGTEMFKDNCKPSTETAYVEQLKQIAKEKFGEIKEGDRFKSACNAINTDIIKSLGDWAYFKQNDHLCYKGVSIYKQGKWAERVKERVRVEFFQDSLDEHNNIEEWGYVFKIYNYTYGGKKSIESGKFIAKQLENYLNDEKGN